MDKSEFNQHIHNKSPVSIIVNFLGIDYMILTVVSE